MNYMDPYKYLKVSETDSNEAIHKRYKKLMLKYHPDKGGDTEICNNIKDAYNAIIENRKGFVSRDISRDRDISKYDKPTRQGFDMNYQDYHYLDPVESIDEGKVFSNSEPVRTNVSYDPKPNIVQKKIKDFTPEKFNALFENIAKPEMSLIHTGPLQTYESASDYNYSSVVIADDVDSDNDVSTMFYVNANEVKGASALSGAFNEVDLSNIDKMEYTKKKITKQNTVTKEEFERKKKELSGDVSLETREQSEIFIDPKENFVKGEFNKFMTKFIGYNK